jgi:hypothetical protein
MLGGVVDKNKRQAPLIRLRHLRAGCSEGVSGNHRQNGYSGALDALNHIHG